MSNPIKYTTGSETLALKKGNFYIGTGDVGKGPTNVTGYYNGITPPSGGYTIYLNKESQGPSIYTASNDAQLISLTNSIAGTSYTTANECLVYFAGQTDKVVLNRDYEGIVTDGLVFNVDAGFTPSYPKNGTTWYDVGGTNNGTFTNGPTFSTDGGGSIVFDGTDDYVNCGNNSIFDMSSEVTLLHWLKFTSSSWSPFIGKTGGNSSQNNYRCWIGSDRNFDVELYGTNYKPLFNVTSTELPNNSWCFLGMRFKNDGTLSGFFNGINKNTVNKSIGSLSTGDFLIGYDKGGAYGGGNIGTVLLYNRALTDDEILQNYNAQKGRFGL